MDLADIKDTFEFFDSWEEKYKFIIELGKELPDLDEQFKTDQYLVRGCQSQVWLHHHIETADNDSQGPETARLVLHMDSDAFIVRGLIHIVTAAYADKSAQQVADYDILGLFEELDLLAHLSATRGNGLRAMVDRIQHIANAVQGTS